MKTESLPRIMTNPLQLLLYPFAMIYGMVTRVRNYMYDRELKPVASFDIPVINVGNLTVGGTGKTPMIEYLVRLLSEYRVATLSRGYGRDTRGFRVAGENDTPATVGDEPYQIFRKFRTQITVAVGEERALAIPMILHDTPETQVVLLDDAFQHRRVKPSLNILLCDYHRPFFRDYVLPAGRLREPRSGAQRADIIVVTKCPAVMEQRQVDEIRRSISKISPRPLFFATIAYEKPSALSFTKKPFTNEVVLVTGIANSKPLLEYVSSAFQLKEHLEFGDHHVYTANDFLKIRNVQERYPGCSILVTEKDAVKMDSAQGREILADVAVYYLPITVRFLSGRNDFDQQILDHVRAGV